eukprot:156891-Pleurochrysis_carterae.AAC.1
MDASPTASPPHESVTESMNAFDGAESCTFVSDEQAAVAPEYDAHDWDLSVNSDWDVAATATGGAPASPHAGEGGGVTHGGTFDFVADGVIGAEYRTMKRAVSQSESLLKSPVRDPYHGRSVDPRASREPLRESFNLMVVGEAGLGKTTLLESFFKSFRDDDAATALFERKETQKVIETRRNMEEATTRRDVCSLQPLCPLRPPCRQLKDAYALGNFAPML